MVDAVRVDDRGNGIKEVQILGMRECFKLCSERVGGERSGGDDHDRIGRDRGDMLVDEADVGMALQRFCNFLSEEITVHGECRAGGHACRVGDLNDERAQAAHFGFQDAGCAEAVVGA